MAEKQSQLQLVEQEFKRELKGNETALKALLQTTFKGFTPELMQKAVFEGMMRGFTFKDFLQKDVYAIPYGQSYSLVTSIDFSRKIAMRSGLAGKSEPKFVEKENGELVSCSITVKRNVDGVIGDYTAMVRFDEYNTKRNLWQTKPYTMIAKVAEMHALRSAFPEEMAKQFIQEELQKEVIVAEEVVNVDDWKIKLEASICLEELQSVYANMPVKAKTELKGLAQKMKKDFQKEVKENENNKI